MLNDFLSEISNVDENYCHENNAINCELLTCIPYPIIKYYNDKNLAYL